MEFWLYVISIIIITFLGDCSFQSLNDIIRYMFYRLFKN